MGEGIRGRIGQLEGPPMVVQDSASGADRFKSSLESLGIHPILKDLPATTRTASQAAQALNCDLAQIVKTILFTGDQTGCNVLVMVSGVNRVSTQRLSEIVGEKVHLADAQTVFSVTGYPIGAVSPFGLTSQPIMLVDEDLSKHPDVWISGGSDHVLANIPFQKLCELTGGKVMTINRVLANPVLIVPYDPSWPGQYLDESKLIRSAMGPYLQAIEHIGSTSVPGLSAKPIIDILGGMFKLEDAFTIIPALEQIGYTYVPEYEMQLPDRRYLTRFRNDRAKIHLHLVKTHSPLWQNHLIFRDRLIADSHLRDAYAQLKMELSMKFGTDRVGYTNAKTTFIKKVLDME